MNKSIYALFVIILPLITTAKSSGEIVRFSGHIDSDQDSIQLNILFCSDYITGWGNESKQFFVSVDKKGNFEFSLPVILHPGRIVIQDQVTGNILCLFSDQLVEPGDDIRLRGEIHGKDEPWYFHAYFTGKGSSKYNCIQALKALPFNDEILKAEDSSQIIRVLDSLLITRLNVLDKFRSELRPEIYYSIKADIVGGVKLKLLRICNYFKCEKTNDLSAAELKKKQDILNILRQVDSSIPANNISLSPDYIQFLYEAAKLNMLFKFKGENIQFKAVYYDLKNNYDFILREKLLSYCLLNDMDITLSFQDIDTDEYTNCLKDAISLIQSTWLKQIIQNLLNTRGKGAYALNWALPADSSGRRVNQSDFNGKVVFLDMWAYSCTGCTLFAQVFHKKIFPLFKDDPNFKMVSIMTSESSKASYMRRLRHDGGSAYTYSNYVNLFGGKGEAMGREIEAHYGIKAYPFILLIDKKGKIYSSTIPFFTNSSSPNIEKLIKLIRKALAES